MQPTKEYLATLKKMSEAFGGKGITYERGRELWTEILADDVVWEGPTFEKPLRLVGREANALFYEFLLSKVPKFNMRADAMYVTQDPDTCVFEMRGGGEIVGGGSYNQRYLSIVKIKNGRYTLMREYCNPFETYRAFGKDLWEKTIDDIMRKASA
jgi:ketosteroid isomerase-like protein